MKSNMMVFKSFEVSQVPDISILYLSTMMFPLSLILRFLFSSFPIPIKKKI